MIVGLHQVVAMKDYTRWHLIQPQWPYGSLDCSHWCAENPRCSILWMRSTYRKNMPTALLNKTSLLISITLRSYCGGTSEAGRGFHLVGVRMTRIKWGSVIRWVGVGLRVLIFSARRSWTANCCSVRPALDQPCLPMWPDGRNINELFVRIGPLSQSTAWYLVQWSLQGWYW